MKSHKTIYNDKISELNILQKLLTRTETCDIRSPWTSIRSLEHALFHRNPVDTIVRFTILCRTSGCNTATSTSNRIDVQRTKE